MLTYQQYLPIIKDISTIFIFVDTDNDEQVEDDRADKSQRHPSSRWWVLLWKASWYWCLILSLSRHHIRRHHHRNTSQLPLKSSKFYITWLKPYVFHKVMSCMFIINMILILQRIFIIFYCIGRILSISSNKYEVSSPSCSRVYCWITPIIWLFSSQ